MGLIYRKIFTEQFTFKKRFVIILHISGFWYSFVKKKIQVCGLSSVISIVIKKLDLVTDTMETLG